MTYVEKKRIGYRGLLAGMVPGIIFLVIMVITDVSIYGAISIICALVCPPLFSWLSVLIVTKKRNCKEKKLQDKLDLDNFLTTCRGEK